MTDFGGREIAGRDVGTQVFAELTKITDTKSAPIKEYADDYGSLTDQQDSLIRRWLDSDIAAFELRSICLSFDKF